jgi:O-antigen ligase
VLGSRQGPWDATLASLRQHPWFGTGFGTSDLGNEEAKAQVASINAFKGIRTRAGTNREHGNSYLALAEYVGILGLLPFSILFFLMMRMMVRMCLWMRRTANARHCAVPVSIVLLAGFVHAFFEDWLVAVGYYLCVFFWVMAFLLYDLMPDRPQRMVSSPLYSRVTREHAAAFAPPQ